MIKLSTKQILLLIILVLFFISGFFVSKYFSDKSKEKIKRELRIERIKNDSIKKVSDGHYSKLVADTLTKRQLKKRVKELEFKIENPIETGVIVLDFDEKETNIQGEKKDSIISITDYYPSKEDPFITYSASINTFDYTTRGIFQIKSLELLTAKGISKDNTTEFNIKVPKFATVSSLDIQSRENYVPKKDDFGYLLGGQAVMDYNTKEVHAGINFGIRYKKTYLTVGTTTNNTIQTGLTFEF